MADPRLPGEAAVVRSRIPRRREWLGTSRGWLWVAGAMLFVIPMAVAISVGGVWMAGAVAGAGAISVALSIPTLRRGMHARTGVLAVEIPVVLLLLSTLVFRIRGSEDIAENPLDPAGLFRVGSLALALFLGAIAFISPDRTMPATERASLSSRPVRLYGLYTAWSFLGALASVVPLLTLFHAGELVATLLVVVGAVRAVGRGAVHRMEEAVYWFSVVLLGSVWLGVVAAPGQAVTPVDSPLPWQVEGVLPHVPANGVGTLGAIVAAWSLGRFFWPLPEGLGRRAPSLLMALFGLVSLIASQYRTGYIAFAIAVIVLLLLRGKGVLNLFIVLAMIGAVFWGRAVLDEAQPVLLRGESAQTASQLSSRLEWWERALPVWTESPIVGKGLLTGTRFEVLGSIGRQETSTIHSTWIEALVGTGLVGTALLAASFLVLFRRSVVEAVGRKGRIVPLLLLIVLGVRSLTGTTFEASGRSVLLFLVLGLALADRWFGRENDRGRPIGALEGGSPGPLPTSP